MNLMKAVDGVQETRFLTYKAYVSMGNNSVKTVQSTRMVVHGQLVEPAVCLSDLYDVFLLDIVRDTRQNLWTMIYRSRRLPNSMRSLTV